MAETKIDLSDYKDSFNFFISTPFNQTINLLNNDYIEISANLFTLENEKIKKLQSVPMKLCGDLFKKMFPAKRVGAFGKNAICLDTSQSIELKGNYDINEEYVAM